MLECARSRVWAYTGPVGVVLLNGTLGLVGWKFDGLRFVQGKAGAVTSPTSRAKNTAGPVPKSVPQISTTCAETLSRGTLYVLEAGDFYEASYEAEAFV